MPSPRYSLQTLIQVKSHTPLHQEGSHHAGKADDFAELLLRYIIHRKIFGVTVRPDLRDLADETIGDLAAPVVRHDLAAGINIADVNRADVNHDLW